MIALDHLAVSAETLEEGVAWVEARLGLPMAGGGRHALMATHNRLMSLGDLYLEVIAPDPEAEAPAWPRWFDLDAFAGPPRLTTWIARCDDLAAEIAQSPAGVGAPLALSRGAYRWRMAVPADGRLPFDGVFPALMKWEGALHPATALPETGARLTRLEITHPDGAALAAALAARMQDPRVIVGAGPAPALRATIATPHGPRVLD